MVLEAVLRRGMEAGREAVREAECGDSFARGLAFAYQDPAGVLKEETEIVGILLSEADLRASVMKAARTGRRSSP